VRAVFDYPESISDTIHLGGLLIDVWKIEFSFGGFTSEKSVTHGGAEVKFTYTNPNTTNLNCRPLSS
jgi:hypothetical protein